AAKLQSRDDRRARAKPSRPFDVACRERACLLPAQFGKRRRLTFQLPLVSPKPARPPSPWRVRRGEPAIRLRPVRALRCPATRRVASVVAPRARPLPAGRAISYKRLVRPAALPEKS